MGSEGKFLLLGMAGAGKKTLRKYTSNPHHN